MAVMEELLQKYHMSKEESVKHELVLANLPLVKYLAGRLMVRLPAGIDQEDLESYGIFGLLEAVEKYNPDLGVSFKIYAQSRVKGAMIDEVRKLNWAPRAVWQKIRQLNDTKEKLQKEYGGDVTDEMLAKAMGIDLSQLHKLASQSHMLYPASLDENVLRTEDEPMRLVEFIRDPASPDPQETVEKEEGRRLLVKAVSELEEKDQLLLSLYYQEKLTLKEISKVLEVSESRVCQLHTRAIDRLRKKVKGYFQGSKFEVRGVNRETQRF